MEEEGLKGISLGNSLKWFSQPEKQQTHHTVIQVGWNMDEHGANKRGI
jgi:hypothetical protein